MHSHAYLNTAKRIVESYDGSIPLASWLKQFFKADKKYGSRDRREISHVCYCFYRLGGAFAEADVEERMLKALFFCSESPNLILTELRPEWNNQMSLPLPEKIYLLSAQLEVKNIFPFLPELSSEIDAKAFSTSFLVQPDLFLRLRPGKREQVIQKLRGSDLHFSLEGACVRLPNQTKLEQVIHLDEEAVIQDYNSQRVTELLDNSKLKTQNSKLSVWDCCAASGGKSILVYDEFKNVQLTVSDVRESILVNLKKRFERAGINNYQSFIADLSSSSFHARKKFDLVICDAPCSGSGTWSRTPEQLKFFKREKITGYASLQKSIVSNAAKGLTAGGFLLYITCSVFREENEEVVEFVQRKLSLRAERSCYFKGYDKKADSLFAALFHAL